MVVKIKKWYKKVCEKIKLKFENYKNCLEPTQLHNKINYSKNYIINIDSLKQIMRNS